MSTEPAKTLSLSSSPRTALRTWLSSRIQHGSIKYQLGWQARKVMELGLMSIICRDAKLVSQYTIASCVQRTCSVHDAIIAHAQYRTTVESLTNTIQSAPIGRFKFIGTESSLLLQPGLVPTQRYHRTGQRVTTSSRQFPRVWTTGSPTTILPLTAWETVEMSKYYRRVVVRSC